MSETEDKTIRLSIDLSQKQFDIIIKSLEEFFRLRMKQTDFVAEQIMLDDSNYDDDLFCDKKEIIDCVLQSALKVAYGKNMYSFSPSQDTLIAADIWRVIRNTHYKNCVDEEYKTTWDVRGDKPIAQSNEPLPKCEVKYVE